MSAPQKINFPPTNPFPNSNNALVSVGTPSTLFMPTTVTQMNATPLASKLFLIFQLVLIL
jgi:hypothetical protein